jgi:thiopurine S-methyltransferase
MDPNFWRQRWENKETGWHESKPNPLLVKHLPQLALGKDRRIFVPLCGKTLDISWLLSHGYRVSGAELSQLAVEQLFMDLGIQPDITQAGELDQWSAKHVDIFVGNIFALSRQALGRVDAVYDRAALVAFPPDMRGRYTAHLMELTNKAPQLLICYDYDQPLMEGPPFSVTGDEIRRHYAKAYDVTRLASSDVSGGLKGKCPATENVWLLSSQRDRRTA